MDTAGDRPGVVTPTPPAAFGSRRLTRTRAPTAAPRRRDAGGPHATGWRRVRAPSRTARIRRRGFARAPTPRAPLPSPRAPSPPSRRRGESPTRRSPARRRARRACRRRPVAVAARIGVDDRQRPSRRPSAVKLAVRADPSQPASACAVAQATTAGGSSATPAAALSRTGRSMPQPPSAPSPAAARRRAPGRRRPPRRRRPRRRRGRGDQRREQARQPASWSNVADGRHRRRQRPPPCPVPSAQLRLGEVAQRPVVQRRGQALGEHPLLVDLGEGRVRPRERRRNSRTAPWSPRRRPPARSATRSPASR